MKTERFSAAKGAATSANKTMFRRPLNAAKPRPTTINSLAKGTCLKLSATPRTVSASNAMKNQTADPPVAAAPKTGLSSFTCRMCSGAFEPTSLKSRRLYRRALRPCGVTSRETQIETSETVSHLKRFARLRRNETASTNQ